MYLKDSGVRVLVFKIIRSPYFNTFINVLKYPGAHELYQHLAEKPILNLIFKKSFFTGSKFCHSLRKAHLNPT
ncbi:hypothetical protein BpHYR1_010687 [Brachionus plicatilis]|uniref:Uncharacterized protein n=1 Tax=Brachionus plicatilis TaxID=10195 RepID=A0A3M7SVK2_BRAPC|nr:hypothetical protein BpHYR1_010687 [Brachionus plicatilis]